MPEETKTIPPKPMRQIIIETDGDNINLVKADVGGKLELIAVLQTLFNFLTKPDGTENKTN